MSEAYGQQPGNCPYIRGYFPTDFLTDSVADPERFNADPDPTFQADADLDSNPFSRVRNFFFNYCFQSLPKLVICNFFSKNAGGSVRGEG